MSQVTEQQVLDALGRVTDPDSGRDVVQLGMISGLGLSGYELALQYFIDNVNR